MSPTPTDVSYRSGNGMDRAFDNATTIATLKGVRDEHVSLARSSRSSRSTGNTSNTSHTPPAAPGDGAGPGNMSGGISVHELKQMTALRMAQAQGHVRVVSSFPYVMGGGQQTQSGSRAPSPSPSGVETVRESRRGQGSARASTSKGVGNSLSDNKQRSRRNCNLGTEPKNGPSNRGNSSGRVAVRGGSTGDIPPTPTSSNGSSRGGGSRRRSPSPSAGRGQSPPSVSASGSKVPPSKTSPPASSMPHGLTVQELKELTKMRLAQEAFNIPVYAVLRASAQQHNRPSSPGGPSAVFAALGLKGPAGRGRPKSPTPAVRHQASRSPGGVGRSAPSSPDRERASGDRPHRRTRRGGRRGRNRSPRPEEQFSPPSLSVRVGSAIGGRGGVSGVGIVGGVPGGRGGYSSPSPSPRERRAAHTRGAWSEPEDQRIPRSSSQPRSMKQDRPLRPLSASNLRNRSTSVGTDCRRLGDSSSGGVGSARGGGDVPNGRGERTTSSCQVDVFGGGVHKKSNGNNHANGARGSGSVSASSGVPKSSGAGPGHLSSRGRSGAAQSRCGIGHGDEQEHEHEHDLHFQQWDSRSRGRGLSAPVETDLSHDAEKLRREGAGREAMLDDHRRTVQEGETVLDRAVLLARTRSNYLESMYNRSGGRGGGVDEVRRARDQNGHMIGVGGDGNLQHPGHGHGHGHYRIQRSYSESVAGMAGSGGRTGDGRQYWHEQHVAANQPSNQNVDGSKGLSSHARQRNMLISQHSQLQRHRQSSLDQEHMVTAATVVPSSVEGSRRGHGPVQHPNANGITSNGTSSSSSPSSSHVLPNGDAPTGVRVAVAIGIGIGKNNDANANANANDNANANPNANGEYNEGYLSGSHPHAHHAHKLKQLKEQRQQRQLQQRQQQEQQQQHVYLQSSTLRRAESASAAIHPASFLRTRDPDGDSHRHGRAVGDPNADGDVGHTGNKSMRGWTDISTASRPRSSRQSSMAMGSESSRGGGGRGGYSLTSNGAGHHASSGPSLDLYREDISHTVAESVLVTPKTPKTSKTPGGSIHRRASRTPSWPSETPPSSAISAASLSLLTAKDHAHPSHASQSSSAVQQLSFLNLQFSQSQRLQGYSSRNAVDDRSTNSSTESFQSIRRDLPDPPARRGVAGVAGVAGAAGVGAGNRSLHAQLVGHGHHHHHHHHHRSTSQRPTNSDFRAERSDTTDGSMTPYGLGMDDFDCGNHDDVMLRSMGADDSEMRMGAYLSASGPSRVEIGLSKMRANGTFSTGDTTSLPSQSPMLSGSRFAGSAPCAFERESFSLLAGGSAGIAGLKSALDAGYEGVVPVTTLDGDGGGDGDGDGRGDGDGGGDGGGDRHASRATPAGGLGSKRHPSPVLPDDSPVLDGSLGKSVNDDKHSPGSSPLMDGLAFPLDLGGYCALGDLQVLQVQESGYHAADENDAEKMANDFLNMDLDPPGAPDGNSPGDMMAGAAGSGAALLHGLEDVNTIGDGICSSSSTSPPRGDSSSCDMGSEFVGDVYASNMFSHDDST